MTLEKILARISLALLASSACFVSAQPLTTPAGEVKGSGWAHTPATLAATVQQAELVIPAATTGSAMFVGKFRDVPTRKATNVPVVLFLHESSRLGLKAIGEWQRWLARKASPVLRQTRLPCRITSPTSHPSAKPSTSE